MFYLPGRVQEEENNVKEHITYLATVMDNSAQPFISSYVDGYIMICNNNFYRLIGYNQEELSCLKWDQDLTPLEWRPHTDYIKEKLSSTGQPQRYEKEYLRKDGTRVPVEIVIHVVKNEQAEDAYYYAFVTDISSRKEAERALIQSNQELNQIKLELMASNQQLMATEEELRYQLKELEIKKEALEVSQARYRAVVEDQTELVCRFLPDGTLTFVNQAFCQCVNKKSEEILGTSFIPQINDADRLVLKNSLATISPENPVVTVECRIEAAGLGLRWFQWTHRAIYDKKGHMMNFQSVGRDISEQKEAQEKIRYLSMHDSLTGLYNRFYFEEEMRRLENPRNNPVAMLMCDVDGLKLVNDSLGHSKGDELLLITAEILKKCFREGDVVARVGGDEFAVLLPRTPQHMVEQALKRVSETIRPHNDANPELPLSISTGYSIRYDNNKSMSEIFKEADNKMYREKLHSRQSNRSVIVQALMKALGARDFITEGHGERLQRLVWEMAQTLDLHNGNANDLRLLAQFHDIGKVGVPDSILFKPGPLEPTEFLEMKRHSEIGHRIALSAPDLVLIADWILKHHEWWNGEGYPLGLKGEDIPLECRILAIADAYDAMTNDRPYRKALPAELAVEEIRKYSGVQFDPSLVDRFIDILMKPQH